MLHAHIFWARLTFSMFFYAFDVVCLGQGWQRARSPLPPTSWPMRRPRLSSPKTAAQLARSLGYGLSWEEDHPPS